MENKPTDARMRGKLWIDDMPSSPVDGEAREIWQEIIDTIPGDHAKCQDESNPEQAIVHKPGNTRLSPPGSDIILIRGAMAGYARRSFCTHCFLKMTPIQVSTTNAAVKAINHQNSGSTHISQGIGAPSGRPSKNHAIPLPSLVGIKNSGRCGCSNSAQLLSSVA